MLFWSLWRKDGLTYTADVWLEKGRSMLIVFLDNCAFSFLLLYQNSISGSFYRLYAIWNLKTILFIHKCSKINSDYFSRFFKIFIYLVGLVAPWHCEILVPQPEIESASPALQGRFLTKSPLLFKWIFHLSGICNIMLWSSGNTGMLSCADFPDTDTFRCTTLKVQSVQKINKNQIC